MVLIFATYVTMNATVAKTPKIARAVRPVTVKTLMKIYENRRILFI